MCLQYSNEMQSRAVTHSFRRAVPTRNATQRNPSLPFLSYPSPSHPVPPSSSSLPFPFASLHSSTPLLSPPHLLRHNIFSPPLTPSQCDPPTATLSTPPPPYHDAALR